MWPLYLARMFFQVPTAMMLRPEMATAPFSIAGLQIGRTARERRIVTELMVDG